jgi:MscS family membrane protein
MATTDPYRTILRLIARGVRAAGLAIALALAASGASAQETAATEPTKPPPGPLDELERQTPRSSLRGFLTAGRAGDWDRAAGYLNLSPVPAAQRAARGPELARELKTVLDRTLWVDLEALSDEPEGATGDGLPRRRDRVGVIETTGGAVDVLVDRVAREDGALVWKVAATTVARIPDLHADFGDGPLGEILPPVFFESRLFEIQLWQWIGLALIAFLAWLVSYVAVRLVVSIARPLAARSSTELDDELLQAFVGPLRLGSAVAIFALLLLPLSLSVPAQRFFANAATIAGIVAATWFVLRVIDVLGKLVEGRLEERGQAPALAFVPLGRRTVKLVVTALAVLAGLDTLGFDVTALIAGLGIGGLAIALALQKTLENLFGGATIIADRPVQVGDFCRFGDRVGTIEDIGMRSTRVRTLDRTVVTIPNAEFSSLQLENFAKRDRIWFHPRIGLRYETTPDQLRHVLVGIRRMLYSHPRVDPDPARIRFVEFGAYSLDLDVFAYVRATDYGDFLEVVEDLNLRIMDVVEASGTGFAFPSSTTYVAKDDGVDPERTRRAEEEVDRWREARQLYLPRFPEERVAELRGSLGYPPPGSPERVD